MWKVEDDGHGSAFDKGYLMLRHYYVYILANRSRTLYIGVTNNLERRVYEHKRKANEGFTKRYNIDRLVYYELFSDVRNAIDREKQLKGWNRAKKLTLIESENPKWLDLSLEWYDPEDLLPP